MPRIVNYKDLVVWQRSMAMVEIIYRHTACFPASEQWSLTSQLRRAAVSIPSNIAEGYGRQATGEYRHHLSISRGSLLELETQLLIAIRLGYLKDLVVQPILLEIEQISKMLATLISRIR